MTDARRSTSVAQIGLFLCRDAVAIGVSFLSQTIRFILGFPILYAKLARAKRQGLGPAVFKNLLTEFGVSVDYGSAELERVPTEGPLLVVMNHPHGILDGFAILAAIAKVRTDFKCVINQQLKLPGLEAYQLPVKRIAESTENLSILRQMHQWLRKGNCLVLFPSGIVAHPREGDWNPSAVRLAEATGAKVLPVFMHGRNSRLFFFAGRIHAKLRTLLLIWEAIFKRGKKLKLSIGAALPGLDVLGSGSDAERAQMLRAITLSLGYRTSATPTHGVPLRNITAPVYHARSSVERSPLAEAIDVLMSKPECRVVKSGQNSVLYFNKESFIGAPEGSKRFEDLIKEIGRLREIEFRRVGQGTGRELDTDQYDEHYSHLIIWNSETSELIGAYRVGIVDEILAKKGEKGLYTGQHFRYTKAFFTKVGKCMELSRCVVSSKYHSSASGVALLFKGMFVLASRTPGVRAFIGAVSVSEDLPLLSRHLLWSYCRQRHGDPKLATLAEPKHPLANLPSDAKSWIDAIARGPKSFEALNRIARAIRPGHYSWPFLFEGYSRLGVKFLSSSVHGKFNSVDTLALLDIEEMKRRDPRRYAFFTK